MFAIFNAIGTANNLAIRDYLNAQKVPQLFAGDGSQALGGASARYPWTIGFLPSYRGEGAVLRARRRRRRGRRRRSPSSREHGARQGHDARPLACDRGKGPRIVASEPYELTSTDVVSQIAQLKALRRGHADAVRDAEVHDPGDRRGEQARLEAAALPRLRLDRADDHGDRAGERARADAGRALDRVRQEPERPDLGEGPGGRALPLDPEALRPGRRNRPTSTTGTG